MAEETQASAAAPAAQPAGLDWKVLLIGVGLIVGILIGYAWGGAGWKKASEKQRALSKELAVKLDEAYGMLGAAQSFSQGVKSQNGDVFTQARKSLNPKEMKSLDKLVQSQKVETPKEVKGLL